MSESDSLIEAMKCLGEKIDRLTKMIDERIPATAPPPVYHPEPGPLTDFA